MEQEVTDEDNVFCLGLPGGIICYTSKALRVF
jgi:hypothetical protein